VENSVNCLRLGSGVFELVGAFMFEDAVYYSRREAQERSLAAHAPDPRVQRVHALLADKYSQLAHRMMAKLDGTPDN